MAKYTAECENCGIPVRRDWRAGQPKLCQRCGISRSMQAALEMRARSGPHYDRWLASNGPAGRPRSKTVS